MRSIYSIILVLSASLIVGYAHAEENGVRVFTNDDLKKQNSPENRASAGKQPHAASSAVNKRKLQKNAEDGAKEKWCRAGTRYRNRIDAAKASLENAAKKHAEAEAKAEQRKKGRQKAAAVSDTGVIKAKNNLARAEKQLSDLEQDAHRRGIPPGWLRCQFSY